MSDLVGNPEDRFERIGNLIYFQQVARLNELEDLVIEQENALAAMGEKIRHREEDIVTLKTKLQQNDRTYAGEKQRYRNFPEFLDTL